MKKSIIAAILVAMTAGMSATTASAGVAWVDQREFSQTMRILNGVADGSLTRHETRVLLVKQRKIARTERRFLRDGILTRHERRKLRRMLNRQDKRIWWKRHN